MSGFRIILILIILTITSCLFIFQDAMLRTLFQAKPSFQEADIQKGEIQKAETQKADIQKAEIQKSDIQKAEIQKTVEDIDPRLMPNAPFTWLHNIFFVETSCVLMNFTSNSSTEASTLPAGGLRMPPRVACSLEAAARAHPHRPVYLVHTCPVDEDAMWRTAPAYAQRVLAFANMRLWVVRFRDLVRDTPLEKVISEGKLARSGWPVVHASDMLRVLVLSQFGGTYLDTDVLILRPLDDMKNFAALEDPKSINNAVMDLGLDQTGQEVAEQCLKELHDNYKPTEWAYNGPQLISRVLKRRCGTNKFSTVTPEQCKGFRILPVSFFHPVYYTEWEKYYKEAGADKVMNAVKDSYGTHMWHKHSTSKNITIRLQSKQPYAQMARRACPSVVEAVGDTF